MYLTISSCLIASLNRTYHLIRLFMLQAKGDSENSKDETMQPVDASLLKGAEDEAESRSIYVKNLSWSTKDATLMKHFDATVSAAGGSIRWDLNNHNFLERVGPTPFVY